MKNIQQLFKIAETSMQNAYAPYSKFRVGAAVLADNQKIYGGCNTENISYPCGTCAEAGAIAAMVADGGRIIKQILTVSDGKGIYLWQDGSNPDGWHHGCFRIYESDPGWPGADRHRGIRQLHCIDVGAYDPALCPLSYPRHR